MYQQLRYVTSLQPSIDVVFSESTKHQDPNVFAESFLPADKSCSTSPQTQSWVMSIRNCFVHVCERKYFFVLKLIFVCCLYVVSVRMTVGLLWARCWATPELRTITRVTEDDNSVPGGWTWRWRLLLTVSTVTRPAVLSTSSLCKWPTRDITVDYI